MTLQFTLSSKSNLCIELTCVMQHNYLNYWNYINYCSLPFTYRIFFLFHMMLKVNIHVWPEKGLRKIMVRIWPPLAWLYVSMDRVRFRQEGTSFSNMSGLTGASSFVDKNMFLLLSLMAQPRLKACKCRYFEDISFFF